MSINVGINYPAFNFGWDFGKPPALTNPRTLKQWYTDNNGEPAVAELLRCLSQMGIKAVRWEILGDGWTYDFAKPRFVAGSKSFDPPQLKEVDDFQDHFLKLLKTFRQVNQGKADKDKIKLMPVLLNYHFFLPAKSENGVVNVKQGRAEVATDPNKRKRFVETFVKPLLNLSSGFKDVVLAWDIMNEPEFAAEKGVDQDALEELLVMCLRAAGQFGQKTTIGWQFYQSQDKWPVAATLVDIHQYHFYPEGFGGRTLGGVTYAKQQQPPLPKAKDANATMLGEIATETRGKPHWDELGNNDSVEERIKLAEKQGYEWVFLWSVNGTSLSDADGKSTKADERTRWDDTTRKSLVAFTKKQVCAPQGHNIGDLV